MTNIIMRLVARCAYVIVGIILSGIVISSICNTYASTPAYAVLAARHLDDQTSVIVTSKFLQILPQLEQLWISITLAWGIFVGLTYYHHHKSSTWNRTTDIHVSGFAWVYNVSLMAFLYFGGKLSPGVAEPFLVLVVFYNSFLVLTSINIVRWWFGCLTGHVFENQTPGSRRLLT